MKRKVNSKGKVQVTGIKKALQESTAYPIGFGFAVQALIPAEPVLQNRKIGDICDESSSDESLDDLFKGGDMCRWRKLLRKA